MIWPFAASTLGAIHEDLPTLARMLPEHGASLVELRTAPDAPVHVGLTGTERAQVRRLFTDAGVQILAVASRVRIAQAGEDETVTESLTAHLNLAADLGARFVRLFPGAPTATAATDELPALHDAEEAASAVVRRLAACLDAAEATGVRIVLETHDSHPRGQDIAALLQRLSETVGDHTVGAIWDVLHPWRVGEDLTTTARALLPYLIDGRGYVQIKDVPSRADKTPVLQGSGAIPLAPFLDLLTDGGYTGPVSLEWERHWYPDVPTLAQALAAASAALAESTPTPTQTVRTRSVKPADPVSTTKGWKR
ncbi:sugar phosphate isomerase/epimerase family protein [Pseudactinotalea sp. Z1748]|uniref:sugar phosphate isomerase/epimerase family protein n=1 Tax=Pseudactinotalea sp. Z1748 TaxID=3413027 RepID=UPI003C7C205F